MSSRFQRPPGRAPVAPVHRGPQAMPQGTGAAPYSYLAHAPNAALLIDFDNVTMGIQKDMQSELRNLLSSDIIKGKVSVQRAYADWRRYPGYIVPLTENSIDLIWAPAYGSSKKNATDIRLAVDAIELVFTRPEIGTFILLSGDSDFSSLVIKLKEYGKYVIGVGIRESSSDLLVQNCDEYYSYNALAGLVRAGDEEVVRWDPWELVTEAINRMARNGDVMRADRLKQVMQDIDPSFDEKDLGMSKFSNFVREASSRGLVTLTRRDDGQYEIGPATATPTPEPRREERRPETAVEEGEREPREGRREERGRGRRSRRGRGRDVERAPRAAEAEQTAVEEMPAELAAPPAAPRAAPAIGTGGERLTRNEALDLVRRAVESLVPSTEESVGADLVRQRAFEQLGRDSESLNSRMFERILKDAHDANLIDLRRRGDTFELSRAAASESLADQINRAAAAQVPTTPTETARPLVPRGMGPRGLSRGRSGARVTAPPPDLLSVGVVRVGPPTDAVATTGAGQPGAAPQPTVALEDGGAAATTPSAESTATSEAPPAAGRTRGGRSRGGRGARKSAAKTATKAATKAAVESAAKTTAPAPAAKTAAPAPAGRGRRGRGAAKKAATKAVAAPPRATLAPAPNASAAKTAPASGGRARRGRGGAKTPNATAPAAPATTQAAPTGGAPAGGAPAGGAPAGGAPGGGRRSRGPRKQPTPRAGT